MLIGPSARNSAAATAAGKPRTLSTRPRAFRRSLPSRLALVFGRLTLQLDVILQAHALDLVELRFQPVHMLFLGFKDVLEQLAADVIGGPFAVGNGFAQRR